MKYRPRQFATLAAVGLLAAGMATGFKANAQDLATAADVPAGVGTPDVMDTRIGTLNFTDGAPSADTVTTVLDHLDFTHALNAYRTGYQVASVQAFVDAFDKAGVEPNGDVMIWSNLLDSQTMLLTGNADTVYYMFTVDLTNGPIVIETPPDALGLFDDAMFKHVIDFGRPGPDRAQGGKFLLVPPGYDGPLPDSGYHVAHSNTNTVLGLGRSFMENNDPAPTVATIKGALKFYPYTPGGFGTSIATLLEGSPPAAKAPDIVPTNFVEGTGLNIDILPPSDASFFDMVNEVIQREPAGALDPEIMGSFAALGMVKGQDWAPDERMQGILTDAALVADATARSLLWSPRAQDGWAYYPDSAWFNPLWQGGYQFETPPPLVTKDGIVPLEPTGYRMTESRFAFFYYATGITPAMAMRLTDVGSQYLIAMRDSDKNVFDGAKSYKVNLPKGIPENNFWSFTVYDNQTRSMLRTPQRYPRAGSQSFPSPAAVANDDGSYDIYFGPTPPEGKEANWIQTLPGKGWNVVLRLYNPLQPYFDKSWQIGEVELME